MGVRLVGVALLAGVLTLTGCTAERPEQQAVRELVEIHVATRSGYDGTVHCTRNPRPWFVGQATTLFICAARRDDGDCDWFRVSTATNPPTVQLDREHGGRVLPL